MSVDVAVLGPVELRGSTGEPVAVAGARLRALVLLLALDANRVVSAGRLVDGVWGADPPAAASNALQALVSRLRRIAPHLNVEAAANGYRLVIDPDRVDAHLFQKLARDDPAAALGLWRGDLDFPEVASAEAHRLNEMRIAALRSELGARIGRGDVVPQLEGLVAAHPLDEALIGLLMRALRANGNVARALDVFEQARRRLAEQLGADPSPELRGLHVELLRAKRPGRGNLPAAVSSFVGRESAVREIEELIGLHRLVTLLGPGGSGKTRLSVEVGGQLPGEVWQAELAPVTDPAEVPQTILTALNLRAQLSVSATAVSALTRLKEAIAGREMLLILDNCEHLIDTVASIADALLRAAPGLRLLTTSREPLGIPGERLCPVEPLALPPSDADATTAATFPSVRLLLDRAAGFTLTNTNAEFAVRVVTALDGMPLAIELAAARLRTLPPAALADRLTDRFRLLNGGSRTAMPRHQTLRAMVDWSWDLLPEPEQRLWRRFALFHGGADLATAEQVCDADPDLLGALVDKSLLVLGGDGRYRMLETIREYGLERLAEAGEADAQRLRLAACLLDLAARAHPQLRGPDQLIWLRRMAVENDNLQASLRAAITACDAPTAYAFVARVGWYWWIGGTRIEGAALAEEVSALPSEDADQEDVALTHAYAAINGLEGALTLDRVDYHFHAAQEYGASGASERPELRLLIPLGALFKNADPASQLSGLQPLFDDPDPWLRAVAHLIFAQLRLNFGHAAELAEADLREALDGFRSVGERWGIGFTLSSLSDLVAARGDFSQAVAWQREAIALVSEIGIREDLPQLEVKLAHQLWLAGELDEARRMLKQSQESAQGLGLAEVTASIAYGLATIARLSGDLDTARKALEPATAMMGNPAFVPQFRAMTYGLQGLIEGAAGDLTLARDYHARALPPALDSKDAPVIAQVLVGVADLAIRSGDPDRAAFLIGAADAIRGSQDRSVPDVDRITGQARAALGDAGFSAAFHRADDIDAAGAAAATGLLSDAPPESPDAERGARLQQ